MKRPTPQAIAQAAERALVYVATWKPVEVLAAVTGLVDAADFYHPEAAVIWRALVGMVERKEPVDPVTLAAAAVREGLHADTAFHRVAAWAAAEEGPAGYSSMVAAYARRVRREATRRRLLVALSEATGALAAGEDEPEETAAHLRAAALAAEEAVTPSESSANAGALLAHALDEAERTFAARLAGAASDILEPAVHPFVNGVIPTLRRGHLLVIGGKAKSGKSHLAGDLAYGWARQGIRGLILSAEDSPDLWVEREACKVADVSIHDLHAGRLAADKWHRLHEEKARQAALPLRIEDERDAKRVVLAIRAAGRAGARFVVIDHLQRLRFPSSRTPEEEIRRTVQEIETAARDAGVSVVLVSQLRREKETGARPHAGDLWGAQAIEATAHAVILLWRYRKSDPTRCKFIRDAWRHGPPDEVDVSWLPHARHFALVSTPRAVEEERW